jgi:hypothetical protein
VSLVKLKISLRQRAGGPAMPARLRSPRCERAIPFDRSELGQGLLSAREMKTQGTI